MPDICLGSAQFGGNYGITNKLGQVSEATVKDILERCNGNVQWIDTAQAYGSAESVLGKFLNEYSTFRIINKMRRQDAEYYDSNDSAIWESEFFESLRRLRLGSIDTLLLHSSLDIKKRESGYLCDWLLSLKERRLVRRIGISIYNTREIENISRDFLDVVQLPLSIYDQRSVNNPEINELVSMGTKIHARSIYLQGLILTPPEDWPKFMDEDVIDKHRLLSAYAIKNNCSLQELAVNFVRDQHFLEAVVVGVCSTQQVDDFIRVWNGNMFVNGKLDWSRFRIDSENVIDPRFWPKNTV